VNARIGQGFDVHGWAEGRSFWLGGVEIAHSHGLAGHSDGDARLHAITDAVLGALGEGDLGSHFPSSDESLRGIESGVLLERVVARMHGAGYRLGNLDTTIIAEAPRLAPYQAAMRERIAALLGAPLAAVNVKITSTDGLGAMGRGEGVAAQAIVLLLPTVPAADAL
jgi:2-C-methyl-D-erythritol 2,4-cyclodiphosphate synthase